MEQHIQASLTTGEIGFLWESYRCETMFLCTFKHFQNVVDDRDILNHISNGIKINEQHIDKIKQVLLKEDFPIPNGYSEKDVNLKAPRLFSNETTLHLLKQIADTRFEVYSKYLKLIARLDIRSLCNECLTNYNVFGHEITESLLNKGLYARLPQIPLPKEVSYVTKKSYLTGWLGERRPLEATQIAQISLNIQRNILLKTLLIGFIQTLSNEEAKNLLEKGKKLADDMIESLNLFLKDADIEAPIPSGLNVTTSTVAPFTDKLVLDFLVDITRCAINYYGEALATSSRRDLFAFYGKTINGTTAFAHQIISLAIENGYLEQPPIAIDYKEIANQIE